MKHLYINTCALLAAFYLDFDCQTIYISKLSAGVFT